MTLYPQLDLVIENPKNPSYLLRIPCLVDTGYQGFILISEEIASQLRLQTLENVTQKLKDAGEKSTKNPVAVAYIEFLSLDAPKCRYKIPCVIKKMKDKCVLGSQMLSLFAKDNQSHLVFNYLQDKIQFVTA